MIVGAVVVVSLPVAQFPAIAPPEIQVSAIYVDADAQTIEQSVATPIEQQMSGVDNMNYMYSLNATANGQMRMIVDFDIATDPNTDLILAQSRETQAASQLPLDVTNYGITVQKSVLAPLMLVALYSPKGTYDAKFLANYGYINLNDPLTRVSRALGKSGAAALAYAAISDFQSPGPTNPIYQPPGMPNQNLIVGSPARPLPPGQISWAANPNMPPASRWHQSAAR